MLLISWCLIRRLLVVSRLKRFVKVVWLRCSCQNRFEIILRSTILGCHLKAKHSSASCPYSLASLILSSQRHCLLKLKVGWWLQSPCWPVFRHLTIKQWIYMVWFAIFLHRWILANTECASCAHHLPSLRIRRHLGMLLLNHFLSLNRAVLDWVEFRSDWLVLVVSDGLCQINALVYKLLASAPQLLILLFHRLAHLKDIHTLFFPDTCHRGIVWLEHLEL